MNATWCPTGKNTYPDRPTAQRALFTARKQHAKARTIEKRVYRCAICTGYHLTHQSPKRPRKWSA